jgi:hypothetical protein
MDPTKDLRAKEIGEQTWIAGEIAQHVGAQQLDYPALVNVPGY